MKFPKEIYVVIEDDGEEEYPVIFTDFDCLDEEQPVAIYKLSSKKTLSIKKELI